MNSECWLWTGYFDKQGYGRYKDKYVHFAHRRAYELANGFISDKVDIHHICGNRACVRPSHLESLPKREHMSLNRKTKIASKILDDFSFYQME